MGSIASAIREAFLRKKLPSFDQLSIGDLARNLNISSPISFQDIIRTLSELPPASITLGSGPLVAGYLHASGYLFLQSDGAVAFGGHVDEQGFFGDNFFLAFMLPGVTGSNGQPITFVHSGNVVGRGELGRSEYSWSDQGFNELIAASWEAVRTTGVNVVLHASTDPWQVLEAAITGAFALIGMALGGIFIVPLAKDCRENGQWRCGFEVSGPGSPLTPGDPTQNTGIAGDYKCRCEYN